MRNSFRSKMMATSSVMGAFLASVSVPAALAIATFALPSVVCAQDLTSGSLAGVVKDDTGAISSGAKVVVKGISNVFSDEITTDSAGRFRLSQIPLGDYTVTITSRNGGTATDTVAVTLGSVSSYEFVTSGGATVIVRARRIPDFDRNATGSVVRVQDTVDRIPLGRSIAAIADLVPQISINDVFGPPSISGSSPAENIYYVNGMNVTNFRNFLGGTTIPFDFYDQVEVKTGGYMAEFGRSTGGAFISTTRTGSNEFHGGIIAYYTPSGLAESTPIYATDLNSPVHSFTKARSNVDRKEGTVWLSGPVWKDHLNFFAFYNPREISISNQNLRDTGAVYRTVTTEYTDPYWGGKVDFFITPKHRLEYTHFSDEATDVTHYITSTGDDQVLAGTGGLTQIGKYTGKFTDWFTLSALYGKSTFNQTSSSALDAEAAVFENGAVVRGNPALLVDVGQDVRENLRIDGDFYFNLAGRHHVKIGWDRENLNAVQNSIYSGGVYYRYYGAATNCGSTGNVINNCVRVRRYQNGGSFDIENTAYYIQDSWDVTDRLSLNIGVRNDTFENFNAAGTTFLKSADQIAPRVGFTWDVAGDRKTKISGFYGRYYLPIAGNTNIRLAGGENFTEDFYTYTGRDSTTLVPTLGTELKHSVLSNGLIPSADTLVSQNLTPQYQDEFIFGIDRRFDNGWKAGISIMYRKLGSAMEDADIDYTGACAYLQTHGHSAIDCTSASFGGSGYVLINPGADLVVTLGDSFGTSEGQTVTIPASVLGFPEAERTYSSVTFTLERPWDGKWSVGASLTLSKSIGNIEGGVKTDNGQDDTGLTQDFDEPGWMDGSYGLLPNHHGVSFKMNGAYQISENFRAGFTASVLSPRKYGCIGYYPFADGRASQSTLTAWYCDGELTPRSRSFDGDWINNIDVSLTYAHKLPVGTMKITGEIFNLLNSQGADQMDENGESGGVGTLNPNYGHPISYQTPRSIRIGLRYEF